MRPSSQGGAGADRPGQPATRVFCVQGCKDNAFLDDDVADVDADADFDVPVVRHTRVASRHSALCFDRAADGVHDADELDRDAIACAFDDAAAMFRDRGLQEFMAVGVEPGERAFLVGSHQSAVSGDIRCENGRKPPLHTMFGHTARPCLPPCSARVYGQASGVSICAASPARAGVIPGEASPSRARRGKGTQSTAKIWIPFPRIAFAILAGNDTFIDRQAILSLVRITSGGLGSFAGFTESIV